VSVLYARAAGFTKVFCFRTGSASGITILKLLVVVATLALLMSLLLPAIQTAREATRNTQCLNNLHQVDDALQVFHDTHRTLPPGWQPDPNNESSYGWASAILRELDEPNLDSQIDRARPVDKVSDAIRSTTPHVYLCPSDSGDPIFPLFAEIGAHAAHAQESINVLTILPRANYVGVFGTLDPDDVPGDKGKGVFIKGKGHRFAQVSRGLSQVVMVGERTTRKLSSSWLGIVNEGEDAAGRIVGYADIGPNRDDADECEFDSRHPGHVNFAWTDGHVDSIHDDIDRQIYRDLANRR